MSVQIQDTCHYCYETQISLSCTECHSVTYCSTNCRDLDWETHKTFCLKKEDPDLATQRRTICLAIINNSRECTLRYLMKRQLDIGFLFVSKINALFSPLTSLETMQVLQVPITEQGYSELNYEIKRATKKPALVVLHHFLGEIRVFTFSSESFATLHASVGKMPQELIAHIVNL